MPGERLLRVAFGGRMRVGKTTAADHLVARHGFVKYALADPIKEIARRDFGWDGLKDDRGRRLLQEIGDVGRNYEPRIWLRKLADRLASDRPRRAVVDDVRLEREVDALHELGFAVARIERPPELVADLDSDPARRAHATEAGLEGAHVEATIDNGGTFAELYARIDAFVAALEGEAAGA